MTRTDPTLVEVQMNLVRPGAPAVARVISNELCMNGKSASFVKHTVFDVGGTPLAGCFRAGQSFGVIPPGVDGRGRAHKVRLYSIACPSWGEDGHGNWLSTTPKRLIDEFTPRTPNDDASDHHLFLGVCSNYLCDLRAGDQVLLTGPNGRRFVLPAQPDAYQYLFVATGTGIAPFRGMVRELLEASDGPCASRVELVMGSPYTTDLLYDDEFRALAGRHGNFRYHTAISREPIVPGARGLYVHALIERDLDHFAPLLGDPRTLIYVCGLEGMQDGLFDVLLRHGLADGYLRPSGRQGQLKTTPRCMLEVY